MLAPPEEGTFDIEERAIPLRSTDKDNSPEQIPLLLEESEFADSSVTERGKVRITFNQIFTLEENVKTGESDNERHRVWVVRVCVDYCL